MSVAFCAATMSHLMVIKLHGLHLVWCNMSHDVSYVKTSHTSDRPWATSTITLSRTRFSGIPFPMYALPRAHLQWEPRVAALLRGEPKSKGY